jgi:hypothetical protein
VRESLIRRLIEDRIDSEVAGQFSACLVFRRDHDMAALNDTALTGSVGHRQHVRKEWAAPVFRVQLAAAKPVAPSRREYQRMCGFGLATWVGPK